MSLPRPSSADLADRRPLAVPGRNCWDRFRADRLAVLVDGEEYYRALKVALLAARRSIMILGWEFDSRTALDRGPQAEPPNTILEVLNHVLGEHPELRVHVLVWETSFVYAWNREFLQSVKLRWRRHPRLWFHRDDNHPLGASHHQKVVVIDDALAFVGGMDIATGRWDTRRHDPADPRRHDPGVSEYPPVHDLMAVVSGEAAAAFGILARERWRDATGRRLTPPPPLPAPWLPGLAPMLTGVGIAIARTSPRWHGEAGFREIERAYLDMIAAARREIYIENQYFASRRIGRALAARLKEPDGPEILVVSCQDPPGLLERTTMGLSRARLYAHLRRYDTHRRLRLHYPVVEGREVKIHSKLMVVDDRFLHLGSANLNNRSMGLDTECDLFIEADGDDRALAAISRLRCDLLAEHLGATPDEVTAAVASHGLLRAVETLHGGRKSLVPLESTLPEEWLDMVPPQELFDPDGPVEDALRIESDMTMPGPDPLLRKFAMMAAMLAGVAAAAALWRWAPLSRWIDLAPLAVWLTALAAAPQAPLLVLALFLLGGVSFLPAAMLIVLVGGVFGVWPGFLYALSGSTASAFMLYGVGRALGRDRVKLLAGRRITRAARVLPRNGILMVALLRVAPAAPFSAVNLLAGAVRLRFRDYAIGTLIGMTPVCGFLSLFGDRAAAVLRRPDIVNTGLLLAFTGLLLAAGLSLAKRLARATTQTQGTAGE